MMVSFLKDRVVLHPGDCLEVLARLEENSIDACVTDPPYHLVSIYKRFANEARNEKTVGNHAYGRHAAGFMGKQWDGGDIAFRPEMWREVYRVLKPGGHILAFGGTRTYHRMACAIEDAGFEIRDCVQWLYGSGFPKSHNVAIGSQWEGWGTALKPACELIVLARKPLSEKTVAANVLRWGCGAINVDGCRVATKAGTNLNGGRVSTHTEGWDRPWKYDEQAIKACRERGAANVAKAESLGRWPANVIHDGSEEVVGAFPESNGAQGSVTGDEPSECHNGVYSGQRKRLAMEKRGDSGSAARFFYTAKADSDDRIGSKHPTVKPLDLMQYLVRLITPPRGTVLDPFAGTGTTGEAAWREGMRAVLIEREDEYQADIRRRMELALAGPDERVREAIKARGLTESPGPLFDSAAPLAEADE